MFKNFCSHLDSKNSGMVVLCGNPKHFHQAILASVFPCVIFHLLPKAKANSVMKVQEKKTFLKS